MSMAGEGCIADREWNHHVIAVAVVDSNCHFGLFGSLWLIAHVYIAKQFRVASVCSSFVRHRLSPQARPLSVLDLNSLLVIHL